MGGNAGGKTVDATAEQLCEFGKRCSGQNFWWHFYMRVITGQMIYSWFAKQKGELTSHCIWANKSFPHLGLAHFGVALAFCDRRPVMTEQSTARWRSILILGSSPGGMGTGSLQSGPGPQYALNYHRRNELQARCSQSGTIRLYLASSYFGQLCEAGLK